MKFVILSHRTENHERWKQLRGMLSEDDMLPVNGHKPEKIHLHTKVVNTKTGEEYPVEFVSYEYDEPEEFVDGFIQGWTICGKCYIMDGMPILVPSII